MSHHDLQETLQSFPPMLNHIIRKPVCEHLARQWRNRHPGAFSLENISEVLEVGIAAADYGVAQLEGWDVGACMDLVGSVHVPRGGSMGLGVFDLRRRQCQFSLSVGGSFGRQVNLDGDQAHRKQGIGHTSISRKFSGGA